MSTSFVPIYPPEFGVFTTKFMPDDLDWTKQQTKHWRWDSAAYAVVDKIKPEDPYQQPEWLQAGIQYSTKEEIVEKLMQHDLYVKSAPKDVSDALGPDTYRLPAYTSSAPISIFRYRFNVDRLYVAKLAPIDFRPLFFLKAVCAIYSRSEPGTPDEIAKRWSLELYHRSVREKRVGKIWWEQMNILQNKLKSFWHQNRNRDPKKETTVWHSEAPGFQQMTWEFELDKEISQGMYDVLRKIQTIEALHVCEKRGEDVRKVQEEQLAADKRRRDELEAKRLEQIAKQEEEQRLWKEKMAREAEEREAKEKKDDLERAAHVATAQMTIQAKIAAFQAACAELTAELQAGKIDATEYGNRMAGLSKMMQ